MTEKTAGATMKDILTDTLFAAPEHVSDIKQVLEIMKHKGAKLREPQIRALILLEEMGNNKTLHSKNPYAAIIKAIKDEYKVAVVNPAYYLDTIEELVPKPPKPVIVTERGQQAKVVK